jgi:hypothetical protein
MQKITIIDGHLWKDGEKLNPEFGNIEQIIALRKYEKLQKEFEDGITPTITYDVEAIANFTCICGSTVNLDGVKAKNTDDTHCFDSKQQHCYKCKRRYEFVLEADYRMYNGKRTYYGSELLVKQIK